MKIEVRELSHGLEPWGAVGSVFKEGRGATEEDKVVEEVEGEAKEDEESGEEEMEGGQESMPRLESGGTTDEREVDGSVGVDRCASSSGERRPLLSEGKEDKEREGTLRS